MPRPSLKDQRSEQILDAYLTCVARFGLEGATQERIAAEAQVKRPLLRHYLGNRDDMIAALTRHVVHGFAQTTDAIRQYLSASNDPADLLDVLFADGEEVDPRLMLAYQALVTAIADHPGLRDPLMRCLTGYLDVIEAALRRYAPHAPEARVRSVTQGIAAAAVNLESLSPLDPPGEWRDELRGAAQLLIASLEKDE